MTENNIENTNTPAPETPQPTPPAPTPAPATPQEPVDMTMKQPAGTATETPKSPMLAIIIGVLVILVAVALGGLYLWGAMLDREQAENERTEPDEMMDTSEETTTAPAQEEPADDIAALESDVESAEINTMEEDLNEIDAEIESGMSGSN